MNKTAVFLLSLLISLTVLATVAMWIFPKTSPSPAEAGGPTVAYGDGFSLQLTWREGERSVGANLRFEPSEQRVRVTGGEAPADRRAVLTDGGLERLLAALGNDLPLTLPQDVRIAERDCYLDLSAGAHLLAAEQVVAVLRHSPALFPAVVTAVLNTYSEPDALLTLLINCSEETDLSAKDGAAVQARLRQLWDGRRGGVAILG